MGIRRTIVPQRHWGAILSRLCLSLVLSLALVGALPGCGGSDGGSAQAATTPTKSSGSGKSSGSSKSGNSSKSGGSSKSSKSGSGGSSGAGSATGADYKLPDKPNIPETFPSDAPFIDITHVDDGYVFAAAKSAARLKFQVKCGEMAYNYDMPNDGSPAIYPVNMGDGSYAFRIMENIEGSSYAELDANYVDVTLVSEFVPFVVPNIFCDYDGQSKCVAKARELAKSATNEGEVVREICTFVAKAVTYDYDKAEILAQGSGYIPNPDSTLAEGKGVCFDFASLTAAMLRSLGMPTKVVTGYVSPDDLYHAWIMVYADGTWQTALFSVKAKTWSRCDVTFASAGASSVTGNGTTYTDRYTY